MFIMSILPNDCVSLLFRSPRHCPVASRHLPAETFLGAVNQAHYSGGSAKTSGSSCCHGAISTLISVANLTGVSLVVTAAFILSKAALASGEFIALTAA